jgi:hypothetical protein
MHGNDDAYTSVVDLDKVERYAVLVHGAKLGAQVNQAPGGIDAIRASLVCYHIFVSNLARICDEHFSLKKMVGLKLIIYIC